jgi:hypothetical protein
MHSARFEIDIISALSTQLVDSFENLTIGLLNRETLAILEREQGVYQLFLDGSLVYVGKADDLPRRLSEHFTKITGRRNIDIGNMGFKCLYVHKNWTTLAPESSLIDHYRSKGTGEAEWNGNGFGPHDPGRNREITNKPPDGFDALYPIREDWPCSWVEPGDWGILDLLVSLKENLPYLLRYQTASGANDGDRNAHYTRGHADHLGKMVHVPHRNMQANELLRLITQELPGWQATTFPSHMILYKESDEGPQGRVYRHGTLIHREPSV